MYLYFYCVPLLYTVHPITSLIICYIAVSLLQICFQNKCFQSVPLVAQVVESPALPGTPGWKSLGWKIPGEQYGYLLHSSTLAWRNSMDRGATWAHHQVHGVTKSWTLSLSRDFQYSEIKCSSKSYQPSQNFKHKV